MIIMKNCLFFSSYGACIDSLPKKTVCSPFVICLNVSSAYTNLCQLGLSTGYNRCLSCYIEKSILLTYILNVSHFFWKFSNCFPNFIRCHKHVQ